VLEGGADWQIVRGDGSIALDVRLVLETIDNALIGMTYRGIRRSSLAVANSRPEGAYGPPTTNRNYRKNRNPHQQLVHRAM
jgi:hypothetical protein